MTILIEDFPNIISLLEDFPRHHLLFNILKNNVNLLKKLPRENNIFFDTKAFVSEFDINTVRQMDSDLFDERDELIDSPNIENKYKELVNSGIVFYNNFQQNKTFDICDLNKYDEYYVFNCESSDIITLFKFFQCVAIICESIFSTFYNIKDKEYKKRVLISQSIKFIKYYNFDNMRIESALFQFLFDLSSNIVDVNKSNFYLNLIMPKIYVDQCNNIFILYEYNRHKNISNLKFERDIKMYTYILNLNLLNIFLNCITPESKIKPARIIGDDDFIGSVKYNVKTKLSSFKSANIVRHKNITLQTYSSGMQSLVSS